MLHTGKRGALLCSSSVRAGAVGGPWLRRRPMAFAVAVAVAVDDGGGGAHPGHNVCRLEDHLRFEGGNCGDGKNAKGTNPAR